VNSAYPFVAEFLTKKSLKDLGYTFDGNGISSFDAEAYSLIASEFNELERKELNGNRNRN
jgi:hypothetical protein